ncbi:MAG TPA: glycosyltransferase family 2 protein, partial [Flavisolibacter sp.]|nr:glycosyltransferase family 2 protein [Flavisolibacter sp.]
TNKGVSVARNKGLSEMKGSFFCFLDSDDLLPIDSLLNRLNYMLAHPTVQALDCAVEVKSQTLEETVRHYQPDFKGIWWKELVKLNEKCFFGPNIFFRNTSKIYPFKTGLTHAEDLFFYIENAYYNNLVYDFVNDTAYIYRKNEGSAMANIKGLERGYYALYSEIKKLPDVDRSTVIQLKLRLHKIIVLSYLSVRDYRNAFLSLTNIFRK